MARLLIVDDEPDVLFLLEANVTAFGHEAVGTSDPQEAWDLLAASAFDGLVLDVSMPGKDGPTLLRELQSEGVAPDHVFLLSAVPPSQLRSLAEELGATAVAKPFTSASLREALGPVLGQ